MSWLGPLLLFCVHPMLKPLALLLAMTGAANACDLRPDSASILIGSRHIGAEIDLNEDNLGLFVGWECHGATAKLGTYDNSFDKQSWALSLSSEYTTLSAGGFNAALIGGVAHYPDTGRHEVTSINGSDVVMMGGIEFNHDATPLTVQIYPLDGKEGGTALVAFGLEWGF